MSVSLEQLRKDIRISQEYLIVWNAILLWDTIATWPSEYRYIWKQKKWPPIKILFVINRYWTICASLTNMILVLSHVSPETCGKIFWLLEFDVLSILFICDIIVAIRVHAVYNKSRTILYLLIVLLSIELGVMIGAAAQLRPKSAPPGLADYLNAPGCVVGNPRMNARITSALFWCSPLVFNLIAFILICFRDFRVTRKVGKIPILRKLVGHGAFYLLVISAASVPNVLLCIQSNEALIDLNVPATLTLTSTMCSRLILALFAPSHPNNVVSGTGPTARLDSSGSGGGVTGSGGRSGGGTMSGNPTSNGSLEPYSITLNGTGVNDNEDMNDGDNEKVMEPKVIEGGEEKDLEGSGGESDGEAHQDQIDETSFAPVLARDQQVTEAELSSSSSEQDIKEIDDEKHSEKIESVV